MFLQCCCWRNSCHSKMSVRNKSAHTTKRGAASLRQERRITYEELKQHSTYSDAWLSINGVVYDITHFIDKHPFGDTFRGNLGTECGGLFSSAHINTNVEALIQQDSFLQKNRIKVVGRLDVSGDHLYRGNDSQFLDRIVYQDTGNDKLWQDLKSGVASYLKDHGETTHYTFREGTLFICYYLCIYACLSYLTWIQGSFLASIVLGIHNICMLSNIAHMATHSGFTENPMLDFIAMHLFDLCGQSGLEWQITHQTHHNQPHSSIDHQTNTYRFMGVRIHKYMKHRGYHRYQYIYFWLVVSLYLLLKMILTTGWILVNREFIRHKYDMATHVLARGIFLTQVLYCFYIHGFWMALVIFALLSITYSQTAFILLFNDHEQNHEFLGEVEDVSYFQGRLSWAEVQVRTSGNWYPTNWFLAFIEFHYGYFNYHIEHHLFPTLKPSLLKKISPIVKSVCIKHGIPYISTPFLNVQKSLQEHLSKMSRDNHAQTPVSSTANLVPATINGHAGYPSHNVSGKCEAN